MVVDDEPALRTFADILLRDLGYGTLLAENGRAAVQLLLQNPEAVSAVLLDMTMPGMPPEETFRLMREIRPGLPVVIFSGEPEETVRARFGTSGIAGYVQKPYSDLELEAALLAALEKPSLPTPAATPVPTPAPFKLARLSDDELDGIKLEFLASRRLELPGMLQSAAAGNFVSLGEIAHKLKGGAGCCGLPDLSRLGAALENAARCADLAGCDKQVKAIQQALAMASACI